MKAQAVVLVLLLLSFSAAAAWMAWASPVKSLPSPSLSTIPACDLHDGLASAGATGASVANRCAAAVAIYQNQFVPEFRLYQSYAEIAEAFAVVVALCLLASVLRAPAFLKREVSLQKPLRLALASLGAAGLGAFAFLESLNLLYAETLNDQFIGLFHSIPQPPVYAVLGLAVACVCFGVLRARRGLFAGLRSGVMLGAFSASIAQLFLLLFDSREMYLYVTRFSSNWVLFGFPVLSNWFVLVVSSGLLALGLAPRRLGLGVRR